jgi:hypothetical protein
MSLWVPLSSFAFRWVQVRAWVHDGRRFFFIFSFSLFLFLLPRAPNRRVLCTFIVLTRDQATNDLVTWAVGPSRARPRRGAQDHEFHQWPPCIRSRSPLDFWTASSPISSGLSCPISLQHSCLPQLMDTLIQARSQTSFCFKRVSSVFSTCLLMFL